MAVVGGRRELMNAPYFVSSTYGGETLGLAALRATLDLLSRKIYDVEELWLKGDEFKRNFNAAAQGVVELRAYPTRGIIMGSDNNRALFFEQMIKAGILMGPSWFYNFPLMEFDQTTIAAVSEVCRRIKLGEVALQGEMPKKPLALIEREKSVSTH